MNAARRTFAATLLLITLLPLVSGQTTTPRLQDTGAQELNARPLHVLSYHPFPDPQGDTWGYPEREANGTRVGYMEGAYDSFWYPTTVFDGIERVEGATAFQQTFTAYEDAFLQRRIEDSPVRAFLLGRIEGDEVVADARLHSKVVLGTDHVDLRLVLFEDEIHFDGGNGVEVHRFVPRATLHDGPVALGADDVTVTERAPIQEGWVRSNLGLVVSLHNRDPTATQFREGEVLQATTWKNGQTGPTIQDRRGVLLETLSATWCAACIYGDGAVDELANEYGVASSDALGNRWAYLRSPQPTWFEFSTGTWETGLLIVALVGSSAALIVDLLPRNGRREAVVRRLFGGSVAALVVALTLLTVYFLRTNLAIEYVFTYTRASYPWYYRLAGLWAGQKGTILMWAAFLGVASLAFLHKSERAIARGEVPSATQSFVLVARRFLIGLVFLFTLATLIGKTFAATPEYLLRFRPTGNGLQPVLLTPFMVIHPPIQFLSYAFTGLVFAAGAAHVATGDRAWVALLRPWVRLNWLLATFGLGLGGLWAYYVLNFGGYWAWDPVETANLIAWFPLTLLLHALLRAKDGGFRATAPFFALLALPAVLFSTVATRTGLWVSVHAFTDPTKNFARDPLVRLLNILETSELLRHLTALFVIMGILAFLALALGRVRDWPTARRRRARIVAAVLAVLLGAAPLFDVVATFGATFQVAHAVTFGRSAPMGLLLLAFALAAVVLLTGPEEAVVARAGATTGWRRWATKQHLLTAGVALLGISFLVVVLLDILSVNGYDRAVYDTRAPYVALPVFLTLAAQFLVALRTPTFALTSVAAATILGALLAFLIAPYWLVVPALVLVALASLGRARRALLAGTTPSLREQLPGLLLMAGALSALLFWANPPTRLPVPGTDVRPSWLWAFPAYALALFALMSGGVLAARPDAARTRMAALALVPLLGLGWSATVLAAAAFALARGPSAATAWRSVLAERRTPLRKASVFFLHFGLAVGMLGYCFSTYAAVQTPPLSVEPGGSETVRGYSFRLADGSFAAGTDPEQGLPHEVQTRVEVWKDGHRLEGATIVHWLVPDDTPGHYDARVTVVRRGFEDVYLYPTSVTTSSGEIHDHVNGARPTDPTPVALSMTVKVLPGVGLVWAGLWLLTLAMAAQLVLGGFAVTPGTPAPQAAKIVPTPDPLRTGV